jgi:hypothetical protein
LFIVNAMHIECFVVDWLAWFERLIVNRFYAFRWVVLHDSYLDRFNTFSIFVECLNAKVSFGIKKIYSFGLKLLYTSIK